MGRDKEARRLKRKEVRQERGRTADPQKPVSLDLNTLTFSGVARLDSVVIISSKDQEVPSIRHGQAIHVSHPDGPYAGTLQSIPRKGKYHIKLGPYDK